MNSPFPLRVMQKVKRGREVSDKDQERLTGWRGRERSRTEWMARAAEFQERRERLLPGEAALSRPTRHTAWVREGLWAVDSEGHGAAPPFCVWGTLGE